MTALLVVSLADARLAVRAPDLQLNIPAIVGRPSAPTPEGMYIIEKAYSSQLNMKMLMFRQEGNVVWAIHPNLPSRKRQLASTPAADNYLSGGCVGISPADFDKIWAVKQPMVLQVHGGKGNDK
jgi:hypothetical protein